MSLLSLPHSATFGQLLLSFLVFIKGFREHLEAFGSLQGAIRVLHEALGSFREFQGV